MHLELDYNFLFIWQNIQKGEMRLALINSYSITSEGLGRYFLHMQIPQ